MLYTHIYTMPIDYSVMPLCQLWYNMALIFSFTQAQQIYKIYERI